MGLWPIAPVFVGPCFEVQHRLPCRQVRVFGTLSLRAQFREIALSIYAVYVLVFWGLEQPLSLSLSACVEFRGVLNCLPAMQRFTRCQTWNRVIRALAQSYIPACQKHRPQEMQTSSESATSKLMFRDGQCIPSAEARQNSPGWAHKQTPWMGPLGGTVITWHQP